MPKAKGDDWFKDSFHSCFLRTHRSSWTLGTKRGCSTSSHIWGLWECKDSHTLNSPSSSGPLTEQLAMLQPMSKSTTETWKEVMDSRHPEGGKISKELCHEPSHMYTLEP